MTSDRAYDRLPTEATLPAAADLDELSPEKVVRLLAREERRSARAVERAAPALARAAELATRALLGGGRIIYVGAGTSGRLCALDAAECPPTFGTRSDQVIAIVAGGPAALRGAVEGAEDDEPAARRALRDVRPGPADLVVGVAASGTTPFVRAALAAARRARAATVFITCSRAKLPADVTVRLDTGPEVLAGSTRLKAGTATKLALNALSTAAMVGAGKCWGPYMVDLRPTSAKLDSRARRIIGRFTGLAAADADRLLARAGGVKVALVMAQLGVTRERARALLAEHGGRLRPLLGAPR